MKKSFSIILCLVMIFTVLISLTSCGSSIQEDWASIIIGENLPTPQKGNLRNGSNLDNGFSGGIENVSADYFIEYKDECIKMGYTIDSEESGDRYSAFNAEGYDLSLYFDGDSISIILSAPVDLSEFEWPTTGIASKLPATVSNLGKITSDSSDCFRITVGNTTIDNYNDYVTMCEQKGFVVDYIKQDKMYEAKDTDGYRLHMSYIGGNRIDIMIQAPKKENTVGSPETTYTKDEIRDEFKDAMDSYEAFFDEYVAFIKKYKESDGTDLSLLTDYTNYLSKYTEMMSDFEEWNKKDLNSAETEYYIQVQGRITQKLLEVAQ